MATADQKTWQKIKFKNFVALQRGFDLPKQDRREGKYPVVASTSIAAYHDEFKVTAPCVTTGRSGALGEVLYINESCWPLNTTLWVKDFKGNNQKFVYYKLKTLGLEKFNAGAGVPTLNRNHLDELSIEIPFEKEKQATIASILSAYDDLIENNEKRIKVLEEMAQLLYTKWFVKFKFPGHEKVKMVDSGTEYGVIPEGWEVKRLCDLIKSQYGYTTSSTSNGGYKFLRGMDINKSSFIDWRNVPFCKIAHEEIDKYRINQGDVFIIRMADPGKIGICEQNVPAVFASYLMRLKIISKLTSYYLFYFLNSKRYQGFINGSSNGTTRKSINSRQVGAINILVPPEKLLTDFENRAAKSRGTLIGLINKNNNLQKIRDLLIPQLVTGKRILK